MQNKKRFVSLTMIFILLTSIVYFAGLGYAAPEQKVTIRILSISIFATAAEKLASEFEKKFGVKVVVDSAPWETLREKQVLELSARTGVYDIVAWCGIGMKEYIDAGWLYPLNEFLKDPKLPKIDLGDFPKAAMDPYMKGDLVYGIPHSAEAFILFYNKRRLKEAGLAIPTTMDELYQAAKKMTDKAKGQYGFACPAAKGEHACSNWSTFLWSWGGDYFDKDWKPIFNSKEGVAALEFFVKLLKDCAPPGVTAWGNEETTNSFAQGELAMMQMWKGLAAIVRDPKRSRVVGEEHFARMPAGPKAQIARFGAWGHSIAADSKYKEEAYKFIYFYNTPENTRNVLLPEGISICRKSVVLDPAILKDEPEFEPQMAALENAKERPGLVEIWEIIEIVGRAVNEAVVGTKSPRVALDEAAVEVYRLLEKAGYYKKK